MGRAAFPSSPSFPICTWHSHHSAASAGSWTTPWAPAYNALSCRLKIGLAQTCNGSQHSGQSAHLPRHYPNLALAQPLSFPGAPASLYPPVGPAVLRLSLNGTRMSMYLYSRSRFVTAKEQASVFVG